MRCFVALCLFLTSMTVHAAEPVRWRGPEIQARLIGNTIVGKAEDFFGAQFMIFFYPDGLVAGVAKKFSVTVRDHGRWEIAGDQLCVDWTRWEGSERLCRETYIKDGEVLMFDGEGSLTSRQVIRKGNPYNL